MLNFCDACACVFTTVCHFVHHTGHRCCCSSNFGPFRTLIMLRRVGSPGLPILTVWQLESRATIVEEQAVSTVKQGPRKERTCEMRPLYVWA